MARNRMAWMVAFLCLAGSAAHAQTKFTVECDASGCNRTDGAEFVEAPEAVSNRTENPGYAGDLRAWTYATWPGFVPGSMGWSPLDSGAGPTLGSVRLTNAYAGATAWGDTKSIQCIAGGVLPSTLYTSTSRVFVPAGQPTPLIAYVGIWYFTGPNCDGTLTSGAAVGFEYGPAGSGGVWAPLAATVQSNPTSRSALVFVQLQKDGGLGATSVEAFYDDVTFSGPALFVKGDINRDGETDLLLHNNVTGENAVWFMDNAVRDGSPATILPAAASLDWVIAGVDDFNADLQNDLLMWNTATGAAEFWLMNGTNRLGAPVPLAGALAPPWKPSATADFNHDGRPDIVYRNFTTQKMRVWLMNGTTQVGEILPVPDQAVDGNWEIVAAFDANTDGNTDFLWYNSTSGKIVYWLMDANVVRITGHFANPANAGDNNWKVLAAGDYGISLNGVWGSRDIVWRNATSGRFVVWHMDSFGNRTFGEFTTPMEPTPNPTDWTIAGPR